MATASSDAREREHLPRLDDAGQAPWTPSAPPVLAEDETLDLDAWPVTSILRRLDGESTFVDPADDDLDPDDPGYFHVDGDQVVTDPPEGTYLSDDGILRPARDEASRRWSPSRG